MKAKQIGEAILGILVILFLVWLIGSVHYAEYIRAEFCSAAGGHPKGFSCYFIEGEENIKKCHVYVFDEEMHLGCD